MKTVKLSQSYTVGSTTFDAAEFREPKLADYRALGPIAERQGSVVVSYRDATWGYVDRLVISPAAGALSELSLRDALVIEGAVNDFFIEANKASREPENSSSGSDGGQEM